jgi:hypothetical protein
MPHQVRSWSQTCSEWLLKSVSVGQLSGVADRANPGPLDERAAPRGQWAHHHIQGKRQALPYDSSVLGLATSTAGPTLCAAVQIRAHRAAIAGI